MFRNRPWMIELLRNADAGAGGGGAAGGSLVDVAKAADAAAAGAAGAGGAAGAAQGGAAGQGAGAQGAGAQGGAGQGQGQGQGQGAAQPYFPEGLDAKLKGKTERETLDNIAKHMAELPKAPAAAKDYTLTVPDNLKGTLDPANDKVLPIWREIAHKHGLTQAQFQSSIVDLYAGMEKAGLLTPAVDINAEFAAIGEKAGGDQASRIQAGQKRVLDVAGKLEALATRQQISKAEAAELTTMLGNRTAVAAVEKLLALLPAEHGLQGGGQSGAGAQNLDDPAVRARLMYPNSQPRSVA